MNWLFKKNERSDSTKGVHPNFRLRHESGLYYQNRDVGFPPRIALKIGFKFDDPHLLDDCPFIAKFGFNRGEGPKYFGLAYGDADEEQMLLEWSQKFEYVRLMKPVTNMGNETDDTKTIEVRG